MKDYCAKAQNPLSCDCVRQDIFCLKLFKLDKLYEQSLVPIALRKHQVLSLDADGTDRPEFMWLREFENHIQDNVVTGQNVYIHSSTCGNGKTAWSIRLLQRYLEAVWWKSDVKCRALFVSVPRYLIALKDSIANENEYANHIKQNILSADLVVWDDIATKTATPFEAENLLSIIDTRMNEGKSNIFTSNLSVEDMTECMGPRITSRIVNFSYNIEFHGKDKRVLRGVLS